MRNKLFVVLCSMIFIAFFVGAPLFLWLTNLGALPYQNVGNQITAEKVYEEDHPLYGTLTAIEKGKVAIKDTYINYLPGFLNITNVFKPFKSRLDRPVIDFLAAKGRELMAGVCRHAYQETRVPPTCTEEGYTLLSCSLCGASETKDPIPARGHVRTEAVRFAGDCERGGYTQRACLYCADTLLEDVGEPTGHDYVFFGKTPSDCDRMGSIVYKCRGCKEFLTLQTPLAHNYVLTADESGAYLYVCTGCDKSFPAMEGDPETHQHDETGVWVDGGCAGIGYTRNTCSICGDESVDGISLPLGHTYTSTVFSPTCTEGGYTHVSCFYCGEEKNLDTKHPKGHSYLKETVSPTVDEDGYDLFLCEYCHDSFKTNFVSHQIPGLVPPTTETDPEGTVYRASLISRSSMFRIYELTAIYPDGTRDVSNVRVIAHDRDGLYQNMLEMSSLINEMVAVKPEVNWYFSFATNIEATALCEEFFPEESVKYIYEDFLRRLPANVKTADIAVNSFRDYADKFYITDHHWNHEGVSEAYYRIISMLRENYADLEPMPLNQLYLFEGVKFYGSLARTNASYDLYDRFGLYYYDLPPHTLTIDPAIAYGSKATLPENLSKYLEGRYATQRGYNHYTEFYRVPQKIEFPENNTGRKLLIIGDSYSLPLLELVAASFDVTYVRYEDRGWNALPNDLYIDEFVEENGITDVLVIEDIVKSIMKGYGTHYPSGFLNIYPYRKED